MKVSDTGLINKNVNTYLNGARFCKYGDHNIAYWMSAERERSYQQDTILFLHGFPSASWDWHKQWEVLQKDHCLLAVDFLGFGASDKPAPHTYSLSEQASIIERVLKHVKLNRCHIVAHDYGVSVAQELLRRSLDSKDRSLESDTILSICFLNGGLFSEAHRPLFTQKLLKSPIGPLVSLFMSKSTLKRSFHQIFSAENPPNELEIESLWSLLNHKNGKRVVSSLLSYIDERAKYRDDWVGAMRQATCPIGFINGVHDPISGLHMLKQFNLLFPDYPSIGISAGHYPQLEQAAMVNRLLVNFMQSGTLPILNETA